MRVLGKLALVVGLPVAALFATTTGASATTADGQSTLLDDVIGDDLVGAEVNVVKIGDSNSGGSSGSGGDGAASAVTDVVGAVTGILNP